MRKTGFLFILLFLCALTFAQQGNFSVVGSKIYHPDGKEYIPVGANVAGPRYSWGNRSLLPQSEIEMYTEIWNLNCMRLNWYMVRSTNQSGNPLYSNDSLHDVVNAYTPLGVVVMIEAHDFTGGLFESATNSDKAALKARFVEFAQDYKDNPYVWFNVINEPGGSNSSSYYQKWVDWHRELISAIRATGNNNVIVVDGMWWGQDAGHTYGDGNISDSHSAILSRGLDILQGNENIVFAFHAYAQWQGSVSRVENYIDRVHAKNMALLCGEAGGGQEGSGSYGDKSSYRNGSNNAWVACKNKDVGMLVWHWQPGDNFNVTTTGNGYGRNINSTTNPTNLTWYNGRHLWDVTHGGGWGLSANDVGADPVDPIDPVDPDGSVKVNDTEFSFSGAWNVSTGSGKYMNNDHYSSSTGAYYEYSFYGTQVKIYGSFAAHHGIANVSLNGGSSVPVDFYGAVRQDEKLIWSSPELPQGQHTIRVSVSGQKNSASSGFTIMADRLDIYNVEDDNVAVSEVVVNPTSASLLVGETVQLSAMIVPLDATNQNISWTSSNAAVASVNSNGLVSALTNGNATITVTTEDGNKTATSLIVVTTPVVPEPGTAVSVNDSEFTFTGTWDTSTGSGKYMNDDHYSSSTGAYFEYSFYGTQLEMYGSIAAHHGIANVSLNGGSAVAVDFYGSVRQDEQLIWTSPELPQGQHTIRVSVSGQKNSASSGFTIMADRLDIYNEVPDSPGNGGAPTQNLILNGGFESDLQSWTVTKGDVVVVTNDVQSGSKAMRIGSSAWSWVQQNLNGFEPGATYTFSAWGKVLSAGNRVDVAIKNGSTTIETLSFTSTSYEQLSAEIVIPANTTWLQVFVTNRSSGTGVVDNLVLTDGTIVDDPENPDTQAPSTPGNLLVDVDQNSATLSWSAASDNVAVTAYKIFQDGLLLTETSALSYYVADLDCGQSYIFEVSAVDAAGNASQKASNTASTLACGNGGGNATGIFQIQGNQIIHPDGSVFLPYGGNMNGYKWGWVNQTLPHVDKAADEWKFNTIRLNCYIKGYHRTSKYHDNGDFKGTWNVNNDMDAIIEAYTSRGIVVQIDAHDWTGEGIDIIGENLFDKDGNPKAPNNAEVLENPFTDLGGKASYSSQYEILYDFFKYFAVKYKDNPYVWLNPMNEPGTVVDNYFNANGQKIKRVPNHWAATHIKFIQDMRALGFNNPIVVDGIAAGQDHGEWWGQNPSGLIPHSSAIISKGQEVLAADPVGNVLFGVHIYHQWGKSNYPQLLTDYVDAVHNNGLALYIGEAGWYTNKEHDDPGIAFHRIFDQNIVLGKGVGLTAWHLQPGDGMALTTQGTFSRNNDAYNPTNLTWMGERMWNIRNQIPTNSLVSTGSLKQSALDGALSKMSNQTEIKVWVADGNMYVENAAGYQLNLMSVSGALLVNQKIGGSQYALELSSFTKGVYIVRMVSEKKIVTEKLFID